MYSTMKTEDAEITQDQSQQYNLALVKRWRCSTAWWKVTARFMTDIVCGFTDQRLGPAPTQAVVWSGGPPLVLAAKLCTGNISSFTRH